MMALYFTLTGLCFVPSSELTTGFESACLLTTLDNHSYRNLEASWLGPWRSLLLGEWSNYKLPESVQKKLVNALKSKCKMEVNEMLLRVILGGGTEILKGEACVAQLSLRNGCYVGRGGYLYEEDSCKTPTAASNTSESRHGLALQLIHEAASKLGQQDELENRDPIILVLDPEVQVGQLYPYYFPADVLQCLTVIEKFCLVSLLQFLAEQHRSCL